MAHTQTTPNTFRHQLGIFDVLAAFAAAISVLVVASQIVSVAAPLWKGGPVPEALLNTGKQIALSVPALLYVAGLCYARRAFRRIGGGNMFTSQNGQDLRSLGWCLLIGGLWAMVAEGLVPYTSDQPIAQTMREVGHAASDPVLSALGLALVLIGKVMTKAARLKAENDAIV